MKSTSLILLAIAALAMGRHDYDPCAAVIGLLAELRATLANPEQHIKSAHGG
jgi:hypothetical protein